MNGLYNVLVKKVELLVRINSDIKSFKAFLVSVMLELLDIIFKIKKNREFDNMVRIKIFLQIHIL